MKEKNWIKRLFAGFLIGAANAVPGVSGGTMAVITGIYDKLLDAIGSFFSNLNSMKRSFLFLLPVVTGALVGLLICLKGLSFALENYQRATLFFFIGLIVGSLPFLFRAARQDRPTLPRLLSFLTALSVMVFIGLMREPLETTARVTASPQLMLLLFAAGAIAAATMVLPGISGSFVLLYLGLYSTFSNAVTSMNLPLLIPMVIGAVCGIIGFSKVMSWLFTHLRGVTFYTVTGLVIGSVVGLWPRGMGEPELLYEIPLFLIGGVVAWLTGLLKGD